MILRMMIGGAIGLLAGVGLGSVLKSRGGTCPLTCNPYSAGLIGLALGAMIAYSIRPGGGMEALASVPPVASVEDYDRLVSTAARPVLVDFYTQRCGYCVRLAPVIGQLAEEYRGKVDFAKVDLGAVPDLGGRYGIRGVPTVLLLAGGQEVRRWTGLKDAQEYRTALDAAVGGN